MFKKLAFFVLVLSVVPSMTHGQDKGLKLLSRSHYIFENTNCQETSSCSLKEAEFLVEDYRQAILEKDGSTGYNYATRLVAKYRTDSLASLEDYVFVEFIKGCVFTSRMENGVLKYDYISTPHLNANVTYKFTEWTIDSYDLDPVYNSLPGESRHAAYRWNETPGSTSAETEHFYGKMRPDIPELYVTDRSAPANDSNVFRFLNGNFQNVSVAFKMCIYKTTDVPESMPQDVNFAKPIYCYEWASSYVYNHESAKFEYPREIVPACR